MTTERQAFTERSPVNGIRTHIRKTLIDRHENPALVCASVEFATAAFYSSQGIGDPEKHDQQAVKKAQKLGLAEEDILKARTLADRLSAQYNL